MLPIGIFAWFGYELSLKESLAHIRSSGFDCVLLWWGEFEGDVPLKKQPDLVRKMGLAVENAHLPFVGCNSLWLPGSDGDCYTRSILENIRDCSSCGISTVVMHITDGPSPPPLRPVGFDRLQRIGEEAEKYHVTVALENLRHPQYMQDVLQALTSPSLGLCYDSGHAQVEFSAPEKYACGHALPTLYADRLYALHLHDNDGCQDLHQLPFDGSLSWEDVAKTLKLSEYAGALTLEVQAESRYENHMNAEAFLQKAYQSANRLRFAVENADIGEHRQ